MYRLCSIENLFCSLSWLVKTCFFNLADMLGELQEHVESIDMANGKFINFAITFPSYIIGSIVFFF